MSDATTNLSRCFMALANELVALSARLDKLEAAQAKAARGNGRNGHYEPVTLVPGTFCTRAQAAAYLQRSTSFVGRLAVEWQPMRVPGKLRERVMNDGTAAVRVFTDDVLAMLPPPSV